MPNDIGELPLAIFFLLRSSATSSTLGPRIFWAEESATELATEFVGRAWSAQCSLITSPILATRGAMLLATLCDRALARLARQRTFYVARCWPRCCSAVCRRLAAGTF